MKTFRVGDVVELDPNFWANREIEASLNSYGLYFGHYYKIKKSDTFSEIITLENNPWSWSSSRFEKVTIKTNEISIF